MKRFAQISYAFLLALLCMPVVAYAATPRNFTELVNVIVDIIELVVPLILGATLVVFIWGLISAWVLNVGDAAQAEKGKNVAIAAIIAFIVMTSVWGIVELIRSAIFF